MQPELSIIICTFNREDFLTLTLQSLALQSLDKNLYEVLVVDNNSTDNTASLCQQLIKEHPDINLTYFLEKNQGLAFARNRGIKESSGRIISFIDDDAEARNDYAKNLIHTFQRYSDYDAIGGKVIPIFPEKKEPAWLSKYIWGVVAKVDRGEYPLPFKKKVPAGCNMAFRKTVFETVGVFDTKLAHRCDDLYIFGKLKTIDKSALYAPDVVVYHHIPPERIDASGIRRLSLNLGSSHRVYLQSQPPCYTLIKFFDYLFKIGAAVILSVGYLMKGEPAKTKIIEVMWFSLVGFLRKKR
jgi:glycosyltransferase involved in cell wall biosynthesis